MDAPSDSLDPSQPELDGWEAERRRLIYWMCFNIESFSALAFGRPQTIDLRDMAIRFPADYETMGAHALCSNSSSSSKPYFSTIPVFDVGNLEASLDVLTQGTEGPDPSFSPPSEGDTPNFFPKPDDDWNSWQLNFCQLTILCSKIASYVHRPTTRPEIPSSSPHSTFSRLWAGIQACNASFSSKFSPTRSLLMRRYFLHSMTILLHRTRLTLDPSGYFVPVTTYAEDSLRQVRSSASLIVQSIQEDDKVAVRTEPGIAFCAHTASLILLESIVNPYVADSDKPQTLQDISTCMMAMQEVGRHWQIGNMYASALSEAYHQSLPGHPPPSPTWPSLTKAKISADTSLRLSEQSFADGAMVMLKGSQWRIGKKKEEEEEDGMKAAGNEISKSPEHQEEDNYLMTPELSQTKRKSQQEIEDDLLMELLDPTFLYPQSQ